MFSWHIDQKNLGKGSCYKQGFKTTDVSIERMAKCITQYTWSPIVWKGGERHSSNFLFADWIALDFDTGLFTMDDAWNKWCDTIHIIAPSKSHMVEKHGKVCERFRVVLKLEGRIETLAQYLYTINTLLDDNEEADPACKDAARFFWPCKDIFSTEAEGYEEAVKPVPEKFPLKHLAFEPISKLELEKKYQVNKFRADRYGLPLWIRDFLEKGIIKGAGRNARCFTVAWELCELGFEFADTLSLIQQAPFERNDFSDQELINTVTSAYKTAVRKYRTASEN